MKLIGRLIIIGIIAGLALAVLLKMIYVATGNKAYILLYNVDYIPILDKWKSNEAVGIAFHFTFCIASVIGLYFILQRLHMEQQILPYFLTYTVGSGILYFLTALTNRPPAATDAEAWLYWTASHTVYSWIVAALVIHWVHRNEEIVGEAYKIET